MTTAPAARTLLATAIGAAAFAAAAAPAAQAAKTKAKIVAHCTGTKLESKALTNGNGKSRGHTELWYSTKDNGTNCVITYDDASGSRMMSATLVVQDRLTSSDTAVYSSYAGGAAVTNTNGKCVQWGGYVLFGKKQFMYTNDVWSHCK